MPAHCRRPRFALLLALLLGSVPLAGHAQQDERFAIQRFDVAGSSLFTAAELERLTAPFVGPDKVFGDVQKALDAIETAYRKAGYTAVQVIVPEQELNQGVVRFRIIETPVGSVTVTGNEAYSNDNIRRSLPKLQEGKTPNAREISESVQLANENAGKQVEVVLGVGKQEGTVDARVAVSEDKIQRFYVTADNTGTRPTGRLRTGVAYQHNNLFDLDHSLTMAYTTSPDKPGDVDVDIYSVGYHVPFYGIGDSLDVIYGYSNVNTPVNVAVNGLGINGKGEVIAVRWNHYFPRVGEYSSRLVGGFDWKAVKSACVGQNGAAVNGVAGCDDYLTSPLSATYFGRLESAASLLDYSLGLAWNIPMSSPDDFTLAAGGRRGRDDFLIAKFSAGYQRSVGNDWLLRLAANAQYNFNTALPSVEQLGLAGSTAVRGFLERIVTADNGIVGNAEVYTPDVAARLGLAQGSLRGLVFYDFGIGRNSHGNASIPTDERLASWGVGMRYALKKNVTVRVDAAEILDSRPEGIYQAGDLDDNTRGDWRAHVGVSVGF